MTRIISTLLLAGLSLSLAAGCYYFNEDYRYSDEAKRAQSSVWDDEDQVVQHPKASAPSDPAPEAEEEVIDVGSTPLVDPEPPARPAVVKAENPSSIILRLTGMAALGQKELVRRVTALAAVEKAEVLSVAKGRIELGIVLRSSLDDFVGQMQAMSGLSVDFLGTTTTILGRLRVAESMGVSIFGPRDGAVLGMSQVWVGVEVKGGAPASVSVNGVTAVPMKTPNRYKAKVPCKNGTNAIVARVVSRAGAVSEARISIKVNDAHKPQEGRSVLVQGKVGDVMGTVTVDGRPVKLDSAGRYRVTVKVAKGARFITVVETDSLGNRTIRKIAVK